MSLLYSEKYPDLLSNCQRQPSSDAEKDKGNQHQYAPGSRLLLHPQNNQWEFVGLVIPVAPGVIEGKRICQGAAMALANIVVVAVTAKTAVCTADNA